MRLERGKPGLGRLKPQRDVHQGQGRPRVAAGVCVVVVAGAFLTGGPSRVRDILRRLTSTNGSPRHALFASDRAGPGCDARQNRRLPRQQPPQRAGQQPAPSLELPQRDARQVWPPSVPRRGVLSVEEPQEALMADLEEPVEKRLERRERLTRLKTYRSRWAARFETTPLSGWLRRRNRLETQPAPR